MIESNEIVELLSGLEEDTSIPRNVKQKLAVIISILKEPAELSIKIDKALQELEDISEDNNIQPHVRTQIWNVVSALEKINT